MQVVYDIEVFKNMNMAGFLRDDKKIFMVFNVKGMQKMNFVYDGVSVYINDPEQRAKSVPLLAGIYGFNNHAYDDYLIGDILHAGDYDYIKNLSDALVSSNRPPRRRFDWWSYDLREQLPIAFSLKKFESMRGLSVLESDIDFNYTGLFNLDQIKEIVKYNKQDLFASLELKNIRKVYFDSKSILVDKYGWGGAQRFSNGTITASYLLGKDKLENYKPKYIKLDGIPDEAKQFLANAYSVAPEISSIPSKAERDKRKRSEWSNLLTEAHGCVYTWSWGGMHAAKGHIKVTPKTKRPIFDYVKRKNVWQVDVTSMFPNIMIRDYLLGGATEKFKNLVADRVENKRKGLPIQKAQKIVINSVYGLLRLISSKLFNPSSAIAVNVAGMVSIYNLADQLDKLGEIIQVNTDGVAFVPDEGVTEDQINHEIKIWEDKFKLKLETTIFKELIQKDVNNYVAIKHDLSCTIDEIFSDPKKLKDNSKNFKLKGGQLTQALYLDYTKASKPTILNKMLLCKLLGGSDETIYKIMKNASLRDFCFTLAATKSATQTGKSILADGTELTNKVNRVYAANQGIGIFKEKTNGTLAKYPNVPEKIKIANDDITKITDISDVNQDYYFDLLMKDYAKWVKNA